MNGYGHFVPSIVWAITYWFAIFAFLGVISMAYARRGAEDSLRARSRLGAGTPARAIRSHGGVRYCWPWEPAAWYYYNAHVLNEYITAADRRHQLADYERQFKKYENLDQPKVTAVDTAIDIFPAQRSLQRHRALYPAEQERSSDLGNSPYRSI